MTAEADGVPSRSGRVSALAESILSVAVLLQSFDAASQRLEAEDNLRTSPELKSGQSSTSRHKLLEGHLLPRCRSQCTGRSS